MPIESKRAFSRPSLQTDDSIKEHTEGAVHSGVSPTSLRQRREKGLSDIRHDVLAAIVQLQIEREQYAAQRKSSKKSLRLLLDSHSANPKGGPSTSTELEQQMNRRERQLTAAERRLTEVEDHFSELLYSLMTEEKKLFSAGQQAPSISSQSTTHSSERSKEQVKQSETPTVLNEYFESVGQINLKKEQLNDLEFEYRQQLGEGERFSEPRFAAHQEPIQSYLHDRKVLVQELLDAQKNAKKYREECIRSGIVVEKPGEPNLLEEAMNFFVPGPTGEPYRSNVRDIDGKLSGLNLLLLPSLVSQDRISEWLRSGSEDDHSQNPVQAVNTQEMKSAQSSGAANFSSPTTHNHNTQCHHPNRPIKATSSSSGQAPLQRSNSWSEESSGYPSFSYSHISRKTSSW